MVRRLAALVLAGGLVAGPSPVVDPPPGEAGSGIHGAAAWVLRIDTPAGSALRLADAAAWAGGAPGADAAPAVAGDVAPVRATADPARPDERVTAGPLHWSDPSGSVTLEGGFAEAQAAPAAATARAGFGSAGGTGFPVANRLFTWEQQERLLAQMSAFNDAVFPPLNARIAALRPILDGAGVDAPRFEPVSPVGLVDIGRGRMASASAEVADSVEFAAGRAEVSVDRVRLLGGFVDAAGVSAEAVSERGASGVERRAGVWYAGLTVAGVPVVADDGRIRVAGNDLAKRAVVQPALDLLLTTLREGGVDLRAGEVRETPDGSRIAALELAVTAPSGQVIVSLAGAQVAPPPPGTPPPADDHRTSTAPPPGVGAPSPSAGVAEVAPAIPDMPGDGGAPAGPYASGTAASADLDVAPPAGSGAISSAGGSPPTSAAPRRAAGRGLQPATTARSLRAVYLLLLVAAAAAAVTLPALIRPATVRFDSRRRSQ